MIRLDTIVLPSALKVTKAWSPVEQNRFYSGDGTLVLQQQLKQGGRQIVLASEKIGEGVLAAVPYSLAQTFEARLTPGRVMVLDLHVEGFSVTWDFSTLPLEFEPLGYRRPPAPDNRGLITLRLLTLP